MRRSPKRARARPVSTRPAIAMTVKFACAVSAVTALTITRMPHTWTASLALGASVRAYLGLVALCAIGRHVLDMVFDDRFLKTLERPRPWWGPLLLSVATNADERSAYRRVATILFSAWGCGVVNAGFRTTAVQAAVVMSSLTVDAPGRVLLTGLLVDHFMRARAMTISSMAWRSATELCATVLFAVARGAESGGRLDSQDFIKSTTSSIEAPM